MKKIRELEKRPKYKYVVTYLLCLLILVFPLIAEFNTKNIVLLVVSIFGIIWFLGERIFPDTIVKNSFKVHKSFIGIISILFIFCVIISEIFAQDYGQIFKNYNAEYENWTVLLCYIVLFFLSINYFSNDRCQVIFKNTVLLLSAIVVVMSLIEFFDLSIAAIWAGGQEKLYNLNRVTLCFGNSDYYGGFCCMLFPFVFEAFIWAQDKASLVINLLLNIGIIFCVFVSKSSLDFYILLFIAFVMIVYEHKRIKIVLKKMLLLIIMLLFFLFFINVLSSGKLLSLVEISATNSDSFSEENEDIYELQDIIMEENKLIIYGNNSKFSIVCNDNISFYDSEDKMMDVIVNGEELLFNEEEYKNVKLKISYINDTDIIYLEIDMGYKDSVDFYIVNGEFKGVGVNNTIIDDIKGECSDSYFNSMFTGRGYIWRNTLPILKEVIIVGKGTGNFVYNYKQYDYVGLIKTHGTHKVIINRPHNIILQYCVDIGIPGTIFMLIIVIYLMFRAVKLQKQCNQGDNWISQATFFSVLIFWMFSMLNDSMISVTPYMWIFLGVNMATQNNFINE